MNMKKAALVVLAAMMCSSAFAAGDAAAGKLRVMDKMVKVIQA
jgi:hypothetical protein